MTVFSDFSKVGDSTLTREKYDSKRVSSGKNKIHMSTGILYIMFCVQLRTYVDSYDLFGLEQSEKRTAKAREFTLTVFILNS